MAKVFFVFFGGKGRENWSDVANSLGREIQDTPQMGGQLDIEVPVGDLGSLLLNQ